MPFQVQLVVQVNPLTPTHQSLQHPIPSTPQTLVQSVVPMTVQKPSSGFPQTPILGVLQVNVPLTSHITMQPLV